MLLELKLTLTLVMVLVDEVEEVSRGESGDVEWTPECFRCL